MRRMIQWTLVSALLTAFPVTAFGFGVGDKAPPLMIKEWARGDAVDIQADSEKKVHIVEFWATWCPPCKASIPLLTSFQHKYDKDLVVIGVTDPDDRGNTPSAIRRFVKKQGTAMDYHVAIDNNAATKNAYMVAAGAIGIPHAFLIGHDGKLVWQGSPLDPTLEDIIPKVIDGTYDVSSAKVEAEVMRRLQALSYPIQLEQWGTVWDGLVEILKIDPANDVALDALVNIYSKELRNTKTFRGWVKADIDANHDNIAAMENLAYILLSIEDISTRVPDLAHRAAKAAYDGSKHRRAGSIAVYANAMYQIGNLDKAIALQKEAVAIASDSNRREIARALDYYELCKTLSDSVN